jgi:hypothetical protein
MRKAVFITGLAAMIGCQNDREVTETTPGHGTGGLSGAIGGAPAPIPSTVGVGGTGGTGGSSGVGNDQDLGILLSCSEELTHNDQCEACRFEQMQDLCVTQWLACLDDPFCSLPYFDCVQQCVIGDFVCENICFSNASQTSQLLIDQFVMCACHACTGICPSG